MLISQQEGKKKKKKKERKKYNMMSVIYLFQFSKKNFLW